MSNMNESCHIWRSHVRYEWAMSRMNESCHVWMSHVTYEWVMSRMKESCHIWRSHVTYEWVMSHMIAHVKHWVTWHVHNWIKSRVKHLVMSHVNDWVMKINHTPNAIGCTSSRVMCQRFEMYVSEMFYSYLCRIHAHCHGLCMNYVYVNEYVKIQTHLFIAN